MSLPDNYRRAVYAGWVGKCIGVRFGAPIENWTYEEIKQALGEVRDYLPLPEGKLFKPDDDTAFPMILTRAILDGGPDVTADTFGETMLNYLAQEKGTLWWGGYGISTEHTAYLNLAAGIPAPLSGSTALNGKILSEQIGGQIFSDLWGLIVPSDVQKAAHYSELASSISHDGAALHGARFVAALASAAFDYTDIANLIEQALTVIPQESEYAQVVRDMVRYHQESPTSWREAFEYLKQHWGYDRYGGVVPIIPNAGIIVLALLYGEGDFSETIEIGNMCGWDTDCNVGNLGAIMGVIAGLEGIESRWRTPMADELVTAGLNGEDNYTDITTCSDIIADCGEIVASRPNSRSPYRYHFSYPGATQGFRISRGAKIIQLHAVDRKDEYFGSVGGLAATIKKLGKKSHASWYVKTNCRVSELSANYYGAVFSPKLYPGQTVTASLYLPADSPKALVGGLFYRSGGEMHQERGVSLVPGEACTLSMNIPHLEDQVIEEVGVIVHNRGDGLTNATVVLQWLTWDGEPDYGYSFDRAVSDGDAIANWNAWRGFWRLEDGRAVGSGPQGGEQYTGSLEWKDYRFSATLIPQLGPMHGIMGRVQGARRSYLFVLEEGHTATLYKKSRGVLHALASIDFQWEYGRAYELALAFEGSSMVASIDGKQLLKTQDNADGYASGRVGLVFGNGGRTDFQRIDLTPLG